MNLNLSGPRLPRDRPAAPACPGHIDSTVTVTHRTVTSGTTVTVTVVQTTDRRPGRCVRSNSDLMPISN